MVGDETTGILGYISQKKQWENLYINFAQLRHCLYIPFSPNDAEIVRRIYSIV